MKKLFNILFYTFLFIAFFSLIILTYKIYQNKNIIYIGAFSILISSLLASSAVMKNSFKDSIEKVSSFYLDKSLVELNNIYELLKNKNNDRVIWILASRIIILVDEISSKIELQHHKKVFALQKFQIQHKIRDLLNYDENEYIPIAFFAGLKNWENAKDSEALKEIKSGIIENQLEERTIIAIFDFIKYPNDYKEPLLDIKIPQTLSELEKWKNNGGNTEITLGAFMYLKNKLNLT